jgi:hypothetical protein
MIHGLLLSGLAAAMFAEQLQPGDPGGPLKSSKAEAEASEVCPLKADNEKGAAMRGGAVNAVQNCIGCEPGETGPLCCPSAAAVEPGSGNSGNSNLGSGTITGKFVREDAASAPQAEASTPDATEQDGSLASEKNIMDGTKVPSGEVGEAGRDHIIVREEAGSAPQPDGSTGKPSDCTPMQMEEGVANVHNCILCLPGDTGPACCPD